VTGLAGRFEKNGFLMSSPEASVKFYSKLADLTSEDVADSLNVRSYKDSLSSD
jgi:hypothetical protein